MVHRVAVIGSGSSGLACTKTCVDQGLEPVCFERGHDIGGLWNFRVSDEKVPTLLTLNKSACLFNFSFLELTSVSPTIKTRQPRRNQTILIIRSDVFTFTLEIIIIMIMIKKKKPWFARFNQSPFRGNTLFTLSLLNVSCLQESSEPGRASIYRSLVANTSKEMMCFSDFPMPADYPNYLHNSQLLQYLRLYAQHFHLLPYVRFQVKKKSRSDEATDGQGGSWNVGLFQMTVTRVAQRPDFSRSGQWAVVTVNGAGEEEEHVFDAVLVCSGQFVCPSSPLGELPGLWALERVTKVTLHRKG